MGRLRNQNIDLREAALSSSPWGKEFNLSTTLNSSLISGLRSNDDTFEWANSGEHTIHKLNSKVKKLERQNQALKYQVSEMQERYNDLKSQRETVKQQVIEDMYAQFIQLQYKFNQEDQGNIKQQLVELKEKYNKLLSEKFEYVQKLNAASTELASLKAQQEADANSFEKKEKLMRVALSKTIKSKLSEPIVKYLISTIWNNPLGLVQYFDNKNQKVVSFLHFCLRKFEAEIAREHENH